MHGIHGDCEKDVLDARTAERLSTRMRLARHMRGLTLKMLADAAGCSESLLSKIENGKAYPSLPMLNRLVQVLDMSMGWMFEDRSVGAPIISRANQRSPAATIDRSRAITVERIVERSEDHLLECGIYHVEAGAGVDQASDSRRRGGGLFARRAARTHHRRAVASARHRRCFFLPLGPSAQFPQRQHSAGQRLLG